MEQETAIKTEVATQTGIRIRFADDDAEGAVRALLQEADLPIDDIAAHLPDFLVALSAAEIVGTVGMEFYGRYALLRSLAVTAGLRGSGIGGSLYDQVMNLARTRGAREVYLLTTTADEFFRRRGFRRVERASLPEPIRGTEECRELCPSTAVCMRKVL